ncbi:MAG TPA: hypothetical protein VND93_26890 [Myxococcales bacterium]|nr:hypothetical protein [Myxococcales bacterium]
MSATTEDAWAYQVLSLARIEGGQLALPDEPLAELGRQIHESADPRAAATALIALATRLQAIPGARPVTNQVCALAAIALGDAPLNAALCLALYGGGG